MTINTTVRLDKELLKKAKQYALDNDTTVSEIIRRGIEAVIDVHELKSGIARELMIRAKENKKGNIPF